MNSWRRDISWTESIRKCEGKSYLGKANVLGIMKMVKLMFMFCCYGNGNVYVMKMAKLASPMLASVTMCNDKISN